MPAPVPQGSASSVRHLWRRSGGQLAFSAAHLCLQSSLVVVFTSLALGHQAVAVLGEALTKWVRHRRVALLQRCGLLRQQTQSTLAPSLLGAMNLFKYLE